MTPPPALLPLLDRLHGNGRLRVWSLIITVMGDAVDPRGGRIAMSDLLGILSRLQVGESAIRTALSRLARDGWVKSERSGRTTAYLSADKARQQFGPAARLIYAAPDAPPAPGWQLSIEQNGTAMFATDGNLPDGALVISQPPDIAPDWLKLALLPPHANAAFLDLATATAPLAETPPADPGDALAARILALHEWRRLALRYPNLPETLRHHPWNRRAANAAIAHAYSALLPVSEAFWSEPTPKEGQILLASRF